MYADVRYNDANIPKLFGMAYSTNDGKDYPNWTPRFCLSRCRKENRSKRMQQLNLLDLAAHSWHKLEYESQTILLSLP
jgi:hypothetical protein